MFKIFKTYEVTIKMVNGSVVEKVKARNEVKAVEKVAKKYGKDILNVAMEVNEVTTRNKKI